MEVATTPWSWGEMGSAESLCSQAERAEALGFHSFWLPENHFREKNSIPSPLTLLAAVAARTTSLKLGCTSYLLPIRNPLLAAEEVAVVDQLCEGRLILGVGRGIQPEMFAAFDIEVADKRKLFASKLELMRRAWRGEPVAEDADDRPVCLSPLPVQQPSPPIWVAAFGPLALKQVAELGLPYLASPMEPLAVLVENYQRHRDLLHKAGHDTVAAVPIMRTVYVSENPTQVERTRTALAETLPPQWRELGENVSDWAMVGDRSYVADRLAEYTERLGVTHLILRGGLPGLDEEEQLRSHEALLDLV